MNAYHTEPTRGGIDGLVLAALGLVAFMGYSLLQDLSVDSAGAAAVQEVPVSQVAQVEPLAVDVEEESAPADIVEAEPQPVDDGLVSAPYEHYTVTQGPHGSSYGHMAIDIAAGKGAVIKSPITGQVTALYIDQWGNPTLVIENDHYQVTLMHGKYKVEVGQEVERGQMVGKESNMGYTTDMLGRSCQNRDCGYHSHLNIFDKQQGQNVNPLDLIGR